MRHSASSLMLLALGCLAAPAVRADVKFVRRDFPVPPDCSLSIDSYRGTIGVLPSEDAQIHIVIALDPGAQGQTEAEHELNTLQVDFKPEAKGVALTVRNPEESGVHFVWSEKQHININYTISVPATCRVDLRTRDGSINVGNLRALVKTVATRGSIFLRHIDGDVEAKVESGDIVVSHCAGQAKLTVRMGNIRVGTIVGAAQLRSTNGDIDVLHALGPISAYADEGDITIRFPAAIGGAAKVETNGGSVTARLDPAARCEVKASSVWGKVHTKLPFTVSSGGDGKRRLNGTLNGGGPLLVLHANGGQLVIDQPRL